MVTGEFILPQLSYVPIMHKKIEILSYSGPNALILLDIYYI